MDMQAETLPFDAVVLASQGGDGRTMEPACALALDANFGSVQRWHDDFVTCARALGGAAGWVLLVFDAHAGTLVNRWAADPAHALAAGVPLLALHLPAQGRGADPGAAAAATAEAWLTGVDWAPVYARYQQAVHAASDGIGAAQDDISGALLLDVRRAGVFQTSSAMLPGARWCDPAAVAGWTREIPADREVVVYCVYGHEVGRATAMRLRAAGLNARYLQGGIDGWQAAGRPLVDKPGGAKP